MHVDCDPDRGDNRSALFDCIVLVSCIQSRLRISRSHDWRLYEIMSPEGQLDH